MHWVYLSPHFDDVVMSCGGMVWEQVRGGQDVEVWTVCAGAPARKAAFSRFARDLHARWGTGPEAVAARRVEDEQAIGLLGARTRYWDLPDCIYRRLPDGRWLVNNNNELWQPFNPAEQGIVDCLAAWIAEGLGQDGPRIDTRLVSPLTLGNHIDHTLVRTAVEQAARLGRIDLWYYPDYPYVAKPDTNWGGKMDEGWEMRCQDVSREALAAWQEAVATYRSQLSTFWRSRAELYASLETYWDSGGGTCLWRPG